MMIEIKPCRCGAKARVFKNFLGKYRVVCIGTKGMCPIYIHPQPWNYETEKDAIEAWNRRVNNDGN